MKKWTYFVSVMGAFLFLGSEISWSASLVMQFTTDRKISSQYAQRAAMELYRYVYYYRYRRNPSYRWDVRTRAFLRDLLALSRATRSFYEAFVRYPYHRKYQCRHYQRVKTYYQKIIYSFKYFPENVRRAVHVSYMKNKFYYDQLFINTQGYCRGYYPSPVPSYPRRPRYPNYPRTPRHR